MEYDYAIRKITAKIIDRLYDNGNLDKAALASLRSAATITSQRAQNVWPLLMKYLPEQFLSKNGEPTIGEIAVFAAIRLYAIQQQGKDELVCGDSTKKKAKDNAEADGVSLFTALSKLRANEDVRVALDRRIQPLLATNNIASVINSLTHLVEIQKATNQAVKIDYPLLAQDLYDFQTNYHRAGNVRLSWGQQYFRVTNSDSIKGEEND
ncbi:type I-E CRISPR-associated protein Cse2/CasB [Lactobacillus sp. ESL0731]|uniref:type I-E CRISPR-associated protein Cse2/CasB n=1 Tax=unclassified Lactobacillus TaxID=2620435 RepID=UPI0023F765DB|nr:MULTISPECIES: type I-E CRISPR-associated protein Cse2/CasB [unclassified Lactobacillus]WEV51051.1 type I-E CRISPR-associated protein Cse2/CasB [Lactobacillus sp. ESL0700]WEV62181.1 type I-E CRISPR-associated protein Cse2/CasB [Lactobacillus sp. ESL0731]